MFGSDSDDDEDVLRDPVNEVFTKIWIALNKWRLSASGSNAGVTFVKRCVFVVPSHHKSDSRLATFLSTHKGAKFSPMVIGAENITESVGCDGTAVYDIAIVIESAIFSLNRDEASDKPATDDVVGICTSRLLVPGGMLLVCTTNPEIVSHMSSMLEDCSCIDDVASATTNNEDSNSNNSDGFAMISGRKTLNVGCNTSGAEYWKKNSDGEAAEKAMITRLCVETSCHEKEQRQLSDAHHLKAVETLRTHGVLILPGLFPEETVMEYGRAAITDMAQAVSKLRSKGIDLLRPGTGPKIENYQELGMREALRCDLRNGVEMKRKLADGGDDLRSHPAIAKVLLEVMHAPACYSSPFPKSNSNSGINSSSSGNVNTTQQEEEARLRALKASRGNWGRWNFEGPGPDGPHPPVRVGTIGCVMSLPGCVDQTIHADTPHIYTHTQLPGHYFNLFLVASKKGGPADSLDCGQTAFVVGSHNLEVCESIMAPSGVGGQTELLKRLVRPHLRAGDALIFDCRILHLGLANRTPPVVPLDGLESVDGVTPSRAGFSRFDEGGIREEGSSSSNSSDQNASEGKPSVPRPLLYINYTREFFEDPKNWNHKQLLFDE
jgi:hypothetical protein